MEISRGAIGILAAACIAGGAGTAYYASHGTRPATPDAVTATGSGSAQVDQSEGVVSDAPVQSAAPVAPPANAPLPSSSRTKAPSAVSSAPKRHDAEAVAPPRAGDTPTAANVAPAIVLPPSRPSEPEPVRAPEPPEPKYLDLVLSQNSVIGLQIETPVTTERAKVEDTVTAHVTRDVRVGDRVAIPAGSKAQGEVTLVERGGKLKDRARLGVRFTSIVLADGTRVPINTETIYREGDSPTNESAAKIGGAAIGGAILGGILGGAKGAAIGTAIGGAGGGAAVAAGGRNAATLSAGSPVTVRLEEPATVTVERE